MKNATKTIDFKTLLLAFLALIVWACDEENPSVPEDSTGTTYELGEAGPAGGIVFYDKRDNTDGWRYMEVTNEDLGEFEWGCYNTPVPEARQSELGTGAENSSYIIAFHDAFQNYYANPAECSTESDGTVAALAAANLEVGGHDDWHLPSYEEMMMIYRNLYLQGLGDFDEDKIYWTSTEGNDNTAYAIDLTLGRGGLLCKQCAEVTTMRAVRYFQ